MKMKSGQAASSSEARLVRLPGVTAMCVGIAAGCVLGAPPSSGSVADARLQAEAAGVPGVQLASSMMTSGKPSPKKLSGRAGQDKITAPTDTKRPSVSWSA